MMRFWLVQGSKKHRRWMKKSDAVKYVAMDRELPQFQRKERGWLYVWDEGVSYAHHWLEKKPVIHKGHKPR